MGLRVEALLALGRPGPALELLESAATTEATASEHLYWQTLASARMGRLTRAQLDAALDRLVADQRYDGAQWASRLAESLQQEARP
jgi:hypothetical protein